MREHSSFWLNDDDHDTHASSTSVPQPSHATGHATLVVTTTEDIVDASDGVLSLREAVTAANLREGPDRIAFAEGIRGETLTLNMLEPKKPDSYDDDIIETLTVTGDLRIDGGEGTERTEIRTSGDADYGRIFDFESVSARLNNLYLNGNAHYGPDLITSTDSHLTLQNVALRNDGEAAGGIDLVGGSARFVGISIDVASYYGPALRIEGAVVQMVDSHVQGSGEGGEVAIAGHGVLTMESSTIEAAACCSSSAIRFEGRLDIANSTLVASVHDDDYFSVSSGKDVLVLEGESVATLNHVTIAKAPTSPEDGAAIILSDASKLTLSNSLIVGENMVSVDGEFVDGGGNVLGDRDGVTLEQVMGDDPELVDNGGPTPTFALIADPSNPAIGAADPATSLPLDQRGFPRDEEPDAGAFEADIAINPDHAAFPELIEKTPLAPDRINGIDPARFVIGADGDAAITFVDEYAAFQSVLGVYLISSDKVIHAPRIVFDHIEHARTSDLSGVSQGARPGGGQLDAGDTVNLSDLYDPGELDAGQCFGLFLIADGASKNDSNLFDSGRLAFGHGTPGSAYPVDFDDVPLYSFPPKLFHIAADGTETLVEGDIIHIADNHPETPLFNSLNAGGKGHVVSGMTDDGSWLIGIEDRDFSTTAAPAAHGDGDFNDLILAIDATETLDAMSWASGLVV